MSKKKGKEEQTLDEKLKMAIIPKEEEPYKVPDNWVWTRLGNITEKNQYGYTAKSSNQGEVKYLRITDIQDNKVVWNDVPYCEIKEDEFEKFKLKKDDIVIARTGATTGKSFLIKEINHKSVFASYLIRVRGIKVLSEYLWDYMNANIYWQQITEFSSGIAQPGVNAQKLENLLIPLPPIDEQKRIVNKLDYFFDKIQKVKEIIEEIKEKNEARKESILSKAFTGELTAKWRADNNYTDVDILLKNIEDEKQNLIKEKVIKRPPKMEPLTEKDFFLDIPKNWKYVKLNDIAFVTKLAGFEYTKNIYPNLVNKGIPLFKGKNVQNGKIVYEFESYIPEEISNELIRSQINKKCLLTPYVGTIGNVALFDGDFKAHLGSNVGKIELFNNFNQNILEEYMLYYFRSCYGLAQLKKHKKATAQESISIEAIRDCVVIIPPIEEQKEIVRILDNIFTKENLINELISLEDKIQALEKSILDKAFRGELGTNSKDDIEAMELLKKILQK